MKTLRTLAVAFPLLAAAAPPSHAAPEKILFVGNSYTGQVKAIVQAFFAASPHKGVKLEFITPGGRTLEQHSQTPATVAKIADGGWDIVVLQDQSQTPAVFPKKFLASSEALNAEITKAGAKTAYYQTWGRRDGDKMNKHKFPTYTKMQDALSASYKEAARRDRAILVPIGEAWRQVRKEKEKLGIELYRGDGSHPSKKGAYLAACCFYAALTGDDPREVKYDAGIVFGEARYFRELGWKAGAAVRAAR